VDPTSVGVFRTPDRALTARGKQLPTLVGVFLFSSHDQRAERLANTAPLRWGFLPCDSAFLFIPALVGVCRFAVSSGSPSPRGGFSGSFSAIARASQPSPPLWGWVKRIPSAPQRGGFSCYRSCPPSWESVPTKISPFRWEFVALAQLASPTSVGVFPIDPDCPTPWESIA
jgi:hypothetical protein